LARLDVARQDQTRGRCPHVEPAHARPRLPELRLGDPHAGVGGVAGRGAAIDVRSRDEAPRDERLGAIQFLLREPRVGAADLDLGGETLRFLALDRAIYDRERLPCPDRAPPR
jgi:hypothetical protein